jgi:hypothetical protein
MNLSTSPIEILQIVIHAFINWIIKHENKLYKNNQNIKTQNPVIETVNWTESILS